MLVLVPLLASATAASVRLSHPGTAREQHAAVLRLLDRPERIRLGAHAGPRGTVTSPLEWDGAAIGRDWHRARDARGVLLRSPELSIASMGDVDAIEVRLSATGTPAAATLLWNDEPVLARADELRNRRTLQLIDPRSTFVIGADELDDRSRPPGATEARPLRFLFLRLDADDRVAVESVRILRKADAYAAGPGIGRQVIDGDARDVIHTSSGTPVTVDADVHQRADLLVSVSLLDRAASARVAIADGQGSSAPVLLEREISGRGWQELRVRLPGPPGRRLIQLRARAVPAGAVLFWGNPLLVSPAPSRPNIVLYVVDALRGDRVCGGCATSAAPFLETLAARGLHFRQAFAAATWTKPSVASILTSLYPQTHFVGSRAYTDVMPDGVTTLAEHLRAAGYLTAQFTANPMSGPLSNLDQGFDKSVGPDGLQPPGAGVAKIRSSDITERVAAWITAHAGDRFFVYVHSLDPHPPFEPPGEPRDRAPLTLYDAEVRENDRQIARLSRHIASLGLARDTLLVVTADHGEAFGEHGRRGHGASVHQEEAHVPLIVARPGAIRPRAVDVPVHHVDIMPAILAHAGVEIDPATVDGVDVAGRPEHEWRDRALFVSRFAYPMDAALEEFRGVEHYAVVRRNLKLLIEEDADGAWSEARLYDLDRDPDERTSLANVRDGDRRALETQLRAFLDGQRVRRSAFLLRHPPPAAAGLGERGGKPAMTKEVIERLRALGYVR
jgi:arylsulfatase A-like enzyme